MISAYQKIHCRTHVADLGSAHMLALDYMRDGRASECINLGNGRGYSVLEVIEASRRVSGRPIEARKEPARAGDPSHLVACSEKARRVLGWEPACPNLEDIIRGAWDWRLAHPEGYSGSSEATASTEPRGMR